MRVIAGRWRGRWLDVPNADGLRPTGDRIRETLFSWLQPYLRGACCLDLFAGSGALGIEAASRGATDVHLFEQQPAAVKNLQAQIEKLSADDGIQVHQHDVLSVLAGLPDSSLPSADIVFVDPPFDAALHTRVLELLVAQGWLNTDALVYVESPAGPLSDLLPVTGPPAAANLEVVNTSAKSWHILKEKRAGNVSYGLVSWGA